MHASNAGTNGSIRSNNRLERDIGSHWRGPLGLIVSQGQCMNIRTIIEDRACGLTTFKVVHRYDDCLDKMLEEFGLNSDVRLLREVDESTAASILKTIVWKDLAYGVELISEDDAQKRAKYIVSLFGGDDVKTYTNGQWEDYHTKGACSFNPLTDHTFDAGVIFIGRSFASCIWVADED